jgi:hypothetical protein
LPHDVNLRAECSQLKVFLERLLQQVRERHRRSGRLCLGVDHARLLGRLLEGRTCSHLRRRRGDTQTD